MKQCHHGDNGDGTDDSTVEDTGEVSSDNNGDATDLELAVKLALGSLDRATTRLRRYKHTNINALQ